MRALCVRSIGGCRAYTSAITSEHFYSMVFLALSNGARFLNGRDAVVSMRKRPIKNDGYRPARRVVLIAKLECA